MQYREGNQFKDDYLLRSYKVPPGLSAQNWGLNTGQEAGLWTGEKLELC